MDNHPILAAPTSEIRWRHRVALIAERLRLASPGEVIPYEELETLADVRDKSGSHDRSAMLALSQRARDRVRRDPGFVFRAIDNVGLKRLTDSEIPDVGAERRRAMRRHARKTQEELECVKDFSALTPEKRLEWNASMAVAKLTDHALKPAAMKRIIDAASASEQQEIGVRALMDMITKP